MKEGKGKEAMGKILKDLTDYTVYHFSTEEKLFEKHGYPESARHKKEHEDLTKQVLDIGRKYNAGEMVLTMDLMNFLKEWLNNHIMQVDKKYSTFLNAKGVK
ncbi:MAG: bacteriohemerythrin [Bacteroidetes bacterium]|nr:bacteriohemerythrin [Bacteroidota bacterium]